MLFVRYPSDLSTDHSTKIASKGAFVTIMKRFDFVPCDILLRQYIYKHIHFNMIHTCIYSNQIA